MVPKNVLNKIKPLIVKKKDLPLSCPNKHTEVWNYHPKVYLPLDKTGKETCPYCGACYILKN